MFMQITDYGPVLITLGGLALAAFLLTSWGNRGNTNAGKNGNSN